MSRLLAVVSAQVKGAGYPVPNDRLIPGETNPDSFVAARKIRLTVPKDESPGLPIVEFVRFSDEIKVASIDFLALDWFNASPKMSCQRRGLRVVLDASDPLCIARIARFGAIATIDLNNASSFSE
jgi:hypothetical protein